MKYVKVSYCECANADYYKSEIKRLKDLCHKLECDLSIEMAKQMNLLVENAALRIATAPESPQLISWQIIKNHVLSLEARIAELENQENKNEKNE